MDTTTRLDALPLRAYKIILRDIFIDNPATHRQVINKQARSIIDLYASLYSDNTLQNDGHYYTVDNIYHTDDTGIIQVDDKIETLLGIDTTIGKEYRDFVKLATDLVDTMRDVKRTTSGDQAENARIYIFNKDKDK